MMMMMHHHTKKFKHATLSEIRVLRIQTCKINSLLIPRILLILWFLEFEIGIYESLFLVNTEHSSNIFWLVVVYIGFSWVRLTETPVPISSFEGVWLWSYESSSTFDHNYTQHSGKKKKEKKKKEKKIRRNTLC